MEQSIIQNITQIGATLKSHHLTCTTAESCTGGGLGYWLTSVSGSSDWYERGFITYSNEAKIDMLGVSKTTLQTKGAVSEEVAREMAIGALKASGADMAISITGIAGPLGGMPSKPVGTVWIGLATRKEIYATGHHFEGDREAIRLQTIKKAIEIMLNTPFF